MTALDVISVQDARDYMHVDYDEDDVIIERIIKSAVAIIERYTNVLLYERSANYTITSGCSNEIYDYPISFTNTSLKKKQNVLSVTVYGKNGDVVATTVGFADLESIELELPNIVEACYKLITYMYENRDAYSADLPYDIQCMVNQYRRSASIL